MVSREAGQWRRLEVGIQKLPLLRNFSSVSAVPSKTWSPDHSTPTLRFPLAMGSMGFDFVPELRHEGSEA